MAVANWSSNAIAKAVLLPFILVSLAMAAGVSSTEDGPVAEAGGRLSSETPLGRKLLTSKSCGSIYSCNRYLPVAATPECCNDSLGYSVCWDVGSDSVDHCGSCTNKCKIGEVCCRGVCANLSNDKNNCGDCGIKCSGTTTCKFAMCVK